MADDILKEAKEAFQYAYDCELDNRSDALEDLRFSRLGEQWPENIVAQREKENRPCLTINKMNAFIRQVVNDARQNKPSIHVHPVDSGADKETADILNGLIRNIEYTSSADVAYDTATEYAVCMGFGYFRIGLDYAHEDTFDLDITIDRVSNPFSVYRDPMSTAADSSDWNSAFVVEVLSKDQFEKDYKGAEPVDWQAEGYSSLADPWCSEDSVMVCEWWKREEYEKTIHLLSDGTIQSDKQMKVLQEFLAATGVTVVKSRPTKCYRVKQYKLTGAECLDSDYEWPGQYIPIIPVYGDEVDVEGKRYFRSLIRDAKDAQRMFNYWRSTTTELVALAPKTPFIGPKGAFTTDHAKWNTANTQSWSFIEHDGNVAPQRQPFVGVPAGAMQEALNASDDMKAIIGLYDASLGARSNETSGIAIKARKVEGDVSTFHFQDNTSRAIRHAGRVLLDLIPHVYDQKRIIRVIGEDQKQEQVPLKQPVPVVDDNGQQKMEPAEDEQGNPIMQPGPKGPVQQMKPMTRIYDLTAGKYDLTVKAGPSFTTRREEAAAQMMEMIQANRDLGPLIGDLVAQNLDWPGADEIAERLKSVNPALNQQGGGIPPDIQKQIDEGMARLQQLEQENAALKADQGVKAAELEVKRQEAGTKQFEAETDRLRLQHEMTQPTPMPQMPTVQ